MKHLLKIYIYLVTITMYKNKDAVFMHNITYLVFNILPGNLKFHMVLSFVNKPLVIREEVEHMREVLLQRKWDFMLLNFLETIFNFILFFFCS